MIRAAALVLALASPAQAVTHSFCWLGANGYRIEGYISYPDTLADSIVTEDDVDGFGITGWLEDVWLGEWSLKDRTPETSFTLRFDARALAFAMGGYPAEGTYQEWNANGFADDCGNPGFGFNGGNRAQDVCVNGQFIEESGISPDTPLAISPDASNPCGILPMSGLPGPRKTHS
ncbi:hypothetical protein [Jannaschia pohangensis]|uniref:Uncharacterized protein n=1 Tax=Jannaschia pohangensis TaxID=390807 RepID=A0A1I3U1X7_9RHOB|nr:hypothetical protein [Jannaschia pohangensis]SFJ77568.1 hypothetical protein SAMN04488095_3612 [Jannaschia pohangensis]